METESTNARVKNDASLFNACCLWVDLNSQIYFCRCRLRLWHVLAWHKHPPPQTQREREREKERKNGKKAKWLTKIQKVVIERGFYLTSKMLSDTVNRLAVFVKCSHDLWNSGKRWQKLRRKNNRKKRGYNSFHALTWLSVFPHLRGRIVSSLVIQWGESLFPLSNPVRTW